MALNIIEHLFSHHIRLAIIIVLLAVYIEVCMVVLSGYRAGYLGHCESAILAMGIIFSIRERNLLADRE